MEVGKIYINLFLVAQQLNTYFCVFVMCLFAKNRQTTSKHTNVRN